MLSELGDAGGKSMCKLRRLVVAQFPVPRETKIGFYMAKKVNVD